MLRQVRERHANHCGKVHWVRGQVPGKQCGLGLSIESLFRYSFTGDRQLWQVDARALAALLPRAWHAGNGVRTIIVETANRFARDLMVQEVGFAMLRGLGATLIAADSPSSFPDDGPASKLMRQNLGAVSEFDKAMIVAKLKGARDRARRARGKCAKAGRPTRSGSKGNSFGCMFVRPLRVGTNNFACFIFLRGNTPGLGPPGSYFQ
jgi:Resolvase, N terminal domain